MVRAATRQDSRAIRVLIREVRINPIGLDWRHFLVAVTPENELIGCGQIKPHFDGSRELASIAVYPRIRGYGVARAIIQELMVRETARPLYLMCRSRLESLYFRFGFHAISPNDMPPYFRLIHRVERIFNHGARQENRLLVMRLDKVRKDI